MSGFNWGFKIAEDDARNELDAGRLRKLGQWEHVVLYVWDLPTDMLVTLDYPLQFETLGDRLSLASWQSDASAEGRDETPAERAQRRDRAIARVGMEWARLEAEFREQIKENPIGTCFDDDIVVARLSSEVSDVKTWQNAVANGIARGDFPPSDLVEQTCFAPRVYVPFTIMSMHTHPYDDGIRTISLAPSISEIVAALVARSKGERLRPFYAFVTKDDDERIVRMLFARLMPKVEAWCAALAADEQATKSPAIHQGSRTLFLRLVDRGRFFIFEIMRKSSRTYADGVLGYANMQLGFEYNDDSDDPVGIGLNVRADQHRNCLAFLTPGALFCVFLHEMAHIMDPGTFGRHDVHDESFQRAFRYNVLLAHKAGLLSMLFKHHHTAALSDDAIVNVARRYAPEWLRDEALRHLDRAAGRGEKRERQETAADDGTDVPAAKVPRFQAFVHLA